MTIARPRTGAAQFASRGCLFYGLNERNRAIACSMNNTGSTFPIPKRNVFAGVILSLKNHIQSEANDAICLTTYTTTIASTIQSKLARTFIPSQLSRMMLTFFGGSLTSVTPGILNCFEIHIRLEFRPFCLFRKPCRTRQGG